MKIPGCGIKAAWLFLAVNGFCGEGLRLESTGVMVARSEAKSGNSFYQTEAFAHWDLPWRWGGDTGFHWQPKLGVTAGWLHGWKEDGFIGTVGPRLALRWKQFPVYAEGGFGPTVMSRDKFGPADFGSILQFTTYGGFTWALGSHVNLGYRYQHMSNGGLAKPNPGLNLHALTASWKF